MSFSILLSLTQADGALLNYNKLKIVILTLGITKLHLRLVVSRVPVTELKTQLWLLEM